MRGLALAVVAMLSGTGVARAEPRPRPLLDMFALVLRYTDAGRWEAGAGVTGGWRSLLDVHLRRYLSDSVTMGSRFRMDLDGAAPRALELEIGKAIGQGKMLFLGDLMTRDRLMLEWGGGAVRFTEGYGASMFVGLALRIQPGVDWLSLELKVRGALAPGPVPASARSTMTPPPPTLAYGLVTELGIAASALWPRPRRECVRVSGRAARR